MDYTPPENIHGPVIRKVMRPLAEAIQKESGSTKVIVTCVYELDKTSEKMSIRMQVSNDNCMERTDAKPPRPTGDRLTGDAEKSIRDILDKKPGDKEGGEHV